MSSALDPRLLALLLTSTLTDLTILDSDMVDEQTVAPDRTRVDFSFACVLFSSCGEEKESKSQRP